MVSPAAAPAIANSAALLSRPLPFVPDTACEAMVCHRPLGDLSTDRLDSFYCIVLLTTLFVSSCYWQPFPLDTPLSTPWAENITTFAEALNSSLSANYTGPIPKVIRAVDRCWCDLSFGGFFAPFTVSNWERVSVLRLKNELEGQQRARQLLQQSLSTEVLDTLNGTFSPNASASIPAAPTQRNATTQPLIFRLPNLKLASLRGLLRRQVYEPEEPPSANAPGSGSKTNADLSRGYIASAQELDLRPYGIDIVIDYNWARL